MKKLLLTTLTASTVLLATAQQRLALFEEFSGENCAPCAAVNPGLWALVSGSGNASKILMIKYQVPIPSAGPLYNQNTTDPSTRRTYYGVTSAPNARLDGIFTNFSGAPNNGHPADLSQADINAAAAIASPFNITVTPTITGNNISVSVQVSAVSAYNASAAKLHVALIETMHFDTPPGTNGEVDFHNVVRKMYPSASGQSIPNTWTVSQSQTFTAAGTIPAYVDKTNDMYVVAWIQDDGTKAIAQAAKSAKLPPPAVDAAITAVVSPANGSIFCGAQNPNHTVTVKNTGTTPLTSVKIFSKVGTGAYNAGQSFPVTIAPGSSTTLNLGTLTLNGPTEIRDSIGEINSAVDDNAPNNVKTSSVAVLVNGRNLPINTGFENIKPGLPADFMSINSDNKLVAKPVFNQDHWFGHQENGITTKEGTYSAIINLINLEPNKTGILTFPYASLTAGVKSVRFSYAYGMRGTVQGDKLELVYSTDCGNSWIPVWTRSSSSLATMPAVPAGNLALPTSVSHWGRASVALPNSLSGNALVGFRATAGNDASNNSGGNLVYVDSVSLAPVAGLSVGNIIPQNSVNLYPNPARDNATIEFYLNEDMNITVQVLDVTGRIVATIANDKMNAGHQRFAINTEKLTSGLYSVVLKTDAGSHTQRLTVVK